MKNNVIYILLFSLIFSSQAMGAIHGPGTKIYNNFLKTDKNAREDKKRVHDFFKRQATIDGDPGLSVEEANDSVNYLKQAYAEDDGTEVAFLIFVSGYYEKLLPELQKQTHVKIIFDSPNALPQFSNSYSLKTALAKTEDYLKKIIKLAEKYHFHKFTFQSDNNYGLSFSFYDYFYNPKDVRDMPDVEIPDEFDITKKPISLRLIEKKLKQRRESSETLYSKVQKQAPEILKKKIKDIFDKTAMRDGNPALNRQELDILEFYFDKEKLELTEEWLEFVDYDITDLYLRE